MRHDATRYSKLEWTPSRETVNASVIRATKGYRLNFELIPDIQL